MEKRNYNRGGGGAGRGRGCGSGGGRGGNKQYHQGQYQTGGGAGNSGGGGGNNCQPHNQGQYQSGGYGRRRGRGGDRSGTRMRTNSEPAQPWGDRPVHGGQGGTQMGTDPPPAQPWGDRSVLGDQGGIERPQSAMGQGAGATGGRRSWSGSPRHVAGRGSWASAEGGGAGAGQARRRILFMFLFLFMFLAEKMKNLPLPLEGLALFDSLHLDSATSLFSDFGYQPNNQSPVELQAVSQSTIHTARAPMNVMVAFKMAHTRASFNPTGELVLWRGYQVSSSSQGSLERLLAQYPQILDRLHVRGASFQTILLDRLASFILEMHSLSLHSLQAEDLDRLSCEVDDLSVVGLDMSPFRVRLDFLSSSFRVVALHLEITSRHHENDVLSIKFLELQDAMAKLKIQFREFESAAQDLEGLIASNAKARDTAITDLEALTMPPLQFEMS